MALRQACLLALLATAASSRIKILGVNSDPCIDNNPLNLHTTSCPNGVAEVPPSANTVYLPGNRGGTVRAVIAQGSNSQYSVPAGQWDLVMSTLGAADCGALNLDLVSGTVTTVNSAFDIPAAWLTSAKQIETAPRRLCIRPAGAGIFRYSGLRVAAVFECSVNTDCSGRTPVANDLTLAGTANLASISAEVAARTVCCAGAPAVTDGTVPATGICIDERTTNCCGGRGFFKGSEKCCQESSQTVRGENQMCPCVRDGTGGSIGCPVDTTCCLPSKYSTTNNLISEGRCFSATTHRCCDTGAVYDPAAQQCCVVSGLQDITTPCPCAADSDCVGGQAALFPATALNTGRCCKAFNPSIMEETRCSKWTNFPSPADANGNRITLDMDGVHDNSNSLTEPITPGQIQNANLQLAQGRCPGRCVDTEYQTCCNGEICHQEYEKCCNSTCCNKFTSHCAEGLRMGSPSHMSNAANLHARFSVCSSVQNLGPIRAFMVYALPTFLLAATLLSLALVLTLAHTVTSRAYSFVEIALMILATFAILFSIPSFFSPAYKYGVLVVLAALLAILSATSRTLWLNALALVAIGVVILYAFNPFSGSVLYDLGSMRNADGSSDEYGDGLIRSVAGGWSMDEDNMDMQRCSTWYTGYFMNDLNIRDWRVENPEDNYFGYCSRAWISTLTILQAVTLALIVGLFALILLAMVLRFRKVAFDAVPGF